MITVSERFWSSRVKMSLDYAFQQWQRLRLEWRKIFSNRITRRFNRGWMSEHKALRVRIRKNRWKNWLKMSNPIVSDVFEWWWDEIFDISNSFEMTVVEVFIEKFEVYYHHLRKINNWNNYDWLRNTIHILMQQIMRQDPFYYRMYVTHWPDNAWRLICYPYYTIYAKPGNKTAFKHIDVNIPELIKGGRGANMIQGSVSLDDKRNLSTFWAKTIELSMLAFLNWWVLFSFSDIFI